MATMAAEDRPTEIEMLKPTAEGSVHVARLCGTVTTTFVHALPAAQHGFTTDWTLVKQDSAGWHLLTPARLEPGAELGWKEQSGARTDAELQRPGVELLRGVQSEVGARDGEDRAASGRALHGAQRALVRAALHARHPGDCASLERTNSNKGYEQERQLECA